MLQIATGKLFVRSVSRENSLRGTLYTNAVLPEENAIDTAAGRLLPSSHSSIRPSTLGYELIERMEDEGVGPGVLISSGIDPYLQEYSIVASFALNCACTPDVDLAKRLTGGQRGLSTRTSPRDLIRRFFDSDVRCSQEEIYFLKEFTEKLILLPRETYLGVMRALRTYVNGMHRVLDDFELSYTLIVASVESLAQEFDGHVGDWDSVEDRKRNAIDDALCGADGEVAERVRAALLRVEHVALARRFREFSISHVSPSYFRNRLKPDHPRLERSDLPEVLAMAYQSRSKYVHQLRRLPDVLTLGHGHGETARDGRVTYLTLQGLSCLMRHVIIEFVKLQPSVAREPYDYHLQRSGVVQMRLAPQYWVGRAEGDITKAGRDKLEGFLEQLSACLLKVQGAALTDLRPVLNAAAGFIPNIEMRLRLPYLALHALFNIYVGRDNSVEMTSTISAMAQRELGEPSSESLVAHAICNQAVSWPISVHCDTLTAYFRRRSAKNGLRVARLFESAMILDLAERLRLSGEVDGCLRFLAMAVENNPGHAGLLGFETDFNSESPIIWRDVMLPS